MAKKNAEAKLLVAQVYRTADEAYKDAEASRGHIRGLVLTAMKKHETVGPVQGTDGKDYWLTYGEKERVEMSSWELTKCLDLPLGHILDVMTVNTARLKELYPQAYDSMLTRKGTTRTAHPCLTWSQKPVQVRTRAKI